MDLHWLSASDHDVAAAMQQSRVSSRARWVPTRRRVLADINNCLMLWYLCIVLMTLGIRIDTLQDNRIEARDVRDIVICSVILVAWIAFASWLHKWSSKPPSPKTRIRAWRGELTALANGFESQSREGATFTSLITAEDRTHFSPRFVADGIEFGNIRYRSRSRSGKWHYIAIQVPISLPHLLLDSHAGKSLERMLPVHVGRYQTLSLEGDFDR